MAKKRNPKEQRRSDGRLPQQLFNYLVACEVAPREPWKEEAATFAERIRRGAWDEIDSNALAELLQGLSVAIRSRYDEPSAAAQDALKQIFDALSCPGPGRPYGFYGLKFDRLYRPGREVLLEEWHACVEKMEEAKRLRRADEEFDVVRFLKKRQRRGWPTWADRISAIKRSVRNTRSPGAKTKREMKKALGLNTRDKPKRRSPETAAINHLI